ncbi:MAG: UDP-glucose/GDP-mannose dehydrogenase family protein [Nanoarchaeota archaeon]|nr:UDP-glucose/GDP-mannose dehydrogenase family protein [Nanoarchaeota archaeon]MBU1269610.1 UDP-glucose/GDP-mannose dehydrogenase family protein [Nanoarchaeota archaeon]MBU1604965.1 UDP-glucose/GDP-mannose dehydrogenase family protein [Nanoarchaeota archaeon]MBU2442833.1 UDP-glucose/GDP-mannose dehydrogenase family protein [Nanoarchaeota archaeon]
MKLAIFGAGYVGLVTSTCFADLGNTVICVDIDKDRINALKKGLMPFFEPGLKELVIRNYKEKRLFFTTDAKEAIQKSDIIFICVGTPPKSNGEANLDFVFDVAKSVGAYINGYKLVVNKSTVPVGTAEKTDRIIKNNMRTKHSFDVVSNPEFLKEGGAIQDFQVPDRIVIGTDSKKAKELMTHLYEPVARINRPIMITDVKTAELIKYASNAMLAARISFMNEISHLCEEVGADIKEVAKGIGLDDRIGPRFLQAGVGYGGSCFPKDVKALAQTLEQHNNPSTLLRAIDYVNERQKRSLLPKLKAFLPVLEGKKIAVWGLSFKPKTSDIRDAPSLVVIEQLKNEYAKVFAYDPEAMPEAKKYLKGVNLVENQYDALKDADALIIVTEWDQFREPDFDFMKQLMKNHIIIDGRNIYDPQKVKDKGFSYKGVGR